LISIPFTSPNQTKNKKTNEREAGKGILRITFFFSDAASVFHLWSLFFLGLRGAIAKRFSSGPTFHFDNALILPSQKPCVWQCAEREKKLLVHVNLARQSIKIKIFFACRERKRCLHIRIDF